MSSSLFARTALAAAVAIVAMAPAMAQNTTAAIGGRVLTPDGKPVAGATVVVLHRESGSTTTLTTDADGRYASRGLRVGGPYTITVTKGGEKSVNEEVYLALAETTLVDLRLGAAQTQLEQVVVTGSAAASSKFGSSSMGAGTQLTRQDLDSYASIQRNLQDYVRNDPRISQTDKERGEISAAGQNSRYNSITIDGVRTNDTFGLEANNLPTIKQPISIDAIQAVQVSLSNYDVTQQGYTGASVNAVTKSGTNEFKGTLYGVYRDANMSGDRFNRSNGQYTNPPPSVDTTFGFTLGGPIIKDNLFFFANYEKLETPRNAPSFGPAGSTLINSGITDARISAAQAAARTSYGMEIGNPWAPSKVLTTVEDTLLKLDWNISEKHRANLRYSKTEQSDPIFPFNSATGISLDSHFYTTVKTLETKVVQWFADWTEDFSTEFKLSQRDYSAVHNNNANLPQVSLVWTTTGQPDQTLRFGQEESRHFNGLATETVNAYFAGNVFVGDHEIKAGLDAEKNDIFNAFQRGSKGVYTFRGADPVALFIAGVPTDYTVQLPQAGRTLEDGAADFALSNLGLFLQDTWTVSSKLTLTGGLRIDRMGVDGAPIRNDKANAAFGYDNSYTMDGAKLVQPRFGFNYAFDSKEKRKSQVRGGFGLFQGSAASVWLTNPFQNTGMAIFNPTCAATGNNRCPADLRFSKDTANQPDITGVLPAAAVDFVSPNVKQPSVWKLNLAWDAELPFAGLVVGAEWLHTKVNDGIYYRHLNLGASTGKSPDGRDMYWNANGLDRDCWTGGANPVSASFPAGCAGRAFTKANASAAFTNVLLLDSTEKGGGNALTLSLSQRPLPGVSWSLAYTRTAATEVSPLTSSTSNSGWLNRAVFNQNEDVASNSNYLIRNRFNAAVSFSKALVGKYKSTVGVVYEGRAGKPYSWTYFNDMNGDGVSGNDLLYVPASSSEVVFTGSTVNGRTPEQRFWDVVDANPELSKNKGGVVKRNGSFAGFTNSFDLRLSQEVPSFFKGHKGVLSLDILNFGNLLNRRWGRIDEIGFPSTRRFVNFNGVTADGKMVYNVTTPDDFVTRQTKGESQWAMQVTARYEF